MAVADGPAFGALLRRHRLAAGLTQEALAERAGLSAHGIQKLEKGATRPYRDTVQRLVAALRLTGEAQALLLAAAAPAPRARGAGSTNESGDIGRPRHNLPAPVSSFIGRERELAEVSQLLAAMRLVTLTGVGGCGKTRLALEAARAALDSFPDGVWLVELAPLADPALAPDAVAKVLGVGEQVGRPLLDAVADALRDRRLLLVLDNCEHLLDACAHLADTLLRRCPHLRILATSREALAIPGEVSRRVPSLSVPRDLAPPLDQVAGSEAVRLFMERARAVRPDVALTDRNAAAVAEVCRRLDGIPLALELAAARLQGLAVEQVAARLDQQFRLLTGGNRAALPRQQTLRAAIDWSYDLLSEPERTLLARLSVFAGGWTLDAAEAVGAGDGIQQDDVVDVLLRLVARSMVVAEDAGDGTSRYRMLEPLRQYGRERLLAAGDASETRDRHGAHFLALAERAEPELTGPRQGAWFDRLEAELDNLRAALEWTVGREAAEVGLRLAGALGWFWAVRDHLSEGRGWLERALAAPGAHAPSVARAKSLDHLAYLAQYIFDPVARRRACEECRAICRVIGDRRRAAWVVRELGLLALDEQDDAQAEALFAQALAEARELGDRWVTAQALEGLAMVATERGDRAAGRRLHADSLAAFRETGDVRAIGWSLLMGGVYAAEDGDSAAARALLSEALAILRELRSGRLVAAALLDLGLVLQAEGDPDGARAHVEQALAAARATGVALLVGIALAAQAWLARAQGEESLARGLALEAVRTASGGDFGWRPAMWVLDLCGVLAVERGAHLRGVRLLGAWAAHRPNLSVMLVGARQASEEALALARVHLGDEALAGAWAEGQAMPPDQAVADALADAAGYDG